nr:ATP-binding protein [Burkholderia sp. Ac-20353]
MRRERQRLEAALRVAGDTLATAAHELRTPMHAMLALVDVVRRDTPAPSHQRLLTLVHESGQRLTRLLDDILTHARADAGGLPIVPKRVDLRVLLAATLALMAPQAHAKGLQLRRQVDDSVPSVVVTDGDRVQQILANLLGNAIKFTAHGTVTLRVSAAPDEHERVGLTLVVEDTGPGIPEALLPHVFTPFAAQSNVVGAGQAGSGLGLAISRQLARALGGDLKLASAAGAGTVATFTLRCRAVAEHGDRAVFERDAVAFDRVKPVEPPADPLCVLVVDDREINRIALRHQLALLGHRAILCDNGRDALDVLEARTPQIDVVLTDYRMPVMDGIALATALREHRDPWLRRIPIVGMTALGEADDPAGWAEIGMNACMRKPVSLDVLRDVIATLGHAVADDGFDPAAIDSRTLFNALGVFDEIGAHQLQILATCRTSLDADRAALARALRDADRPALHAWSHAARGTYSLFGQAHIDRLLDRFHAAVSSGDADAQGDVGAHVLKMTDHLLACVDARMRAAGDRGTE